MPVDHRAGRRRGVEDHLEVGANRDRDVEDGLPVGAVHAREHPSGLARRELRGEKVAVPEMGPVEPDELVGQDRSLVVKLDTGGPRGETAQDDLLMRGVGAHAQRDRSARALETVRSTAFRKSSPPPGVPSIRRCPRKASVR